VVPPSLHCPLLSAPCLHEKCAWWVSIDLPGGCAMKEVAFELRRVNHALKPPPSKTPISKDEREHYPSPAAGLHNDEYT
jgi:hypothetical protein